MDEQGTILTKEGLQRLEKAVIEWRKEKNK